MATSAVAAETDPAPTTAVTAGSSTMTAAAINLRNMGLLDGRKMQSGV
jgi:hypothetical protein